MTTPHFVSNRDESPRLFMTPWLERLSHVHPAVPVLIYAPVIAFFSWHAFTVAGAFQAAGQVLAGVVVWTLVEYALHRWIFHYEPTTTWGKRIHFLSHGVHHDYPRDSTRLVMPPAVSLPLAVLFWAVFTLFTKSYANGLFAGFALGYLAYDMIHFATHHWPMHGRIGRALKRYHLLHHYDDEHTGFGVSSPLWDIVFRTLPRHRTGSQP